MKYSLTLAAAGFVLPVVLASQVVDTSCSDCGQLQKKETDCTKPEIELQGHAECMCGNDFFPKWRSCRTCLFKLSQTTEDIYNDNMQAIEKVYDSFCVAKHPQALFQKSFGDALGNTEFTTAAGVDSVSASSTTWGEVASAPAQDLTGSQSTGGSVRPTTTAFASVTSLTASTTVSGNVSGTTSRITSSSSSSGSRITPSTGRNSTASGALPTGAAIHAVQVAPGLAMALIGAAALMGL